MAEAKLRRATNVGARAAIGVLAALGLLVALRPSPARSPAEPATSGAASSVPATLAEDGAPVPPDHAVHCTDLSGAPEVSRPTLSSVVTERLRLATWRVERALARPHRSRELRVGLDVALHAELGARTLRLLETAPDRNANGFDLLADAASLGSRRAWDAGHLSRARELALVAQRYAPLDPLPLLLEHLIETLRDEPRRASAALARAFALAPREPAVALAYFLELRDDTELDQSLAAADAYLASNPWDLFVARERARTSVRRAYLGDTVHRERHGVRLLAPRRTPESVIAETLSTVDRALDDAAVLLSSPRRNELSVLLYPSHRAIQHAYCEPAWVGGLYDGALHIDASELTMDVARASVVLRHEVMHASMREALWDSSARAPTWFSEGVAQYFAGETAPVAEATMLRHHTLIPLASMDGSFGVIDDSADAGLAYAQSLAMVRYLVHRRGEGGIAEGMRYLIEGRDPHALLAGVGAPLDGETLLAFLAEDHERRR